MAYKFHWLFTLSILAVTICEAYACQATALTHSLAHEEQASLIICNVSMEIQGQPLLNQVVELICSCEYSNTSENVSLAVSLPPGFKLISGAITYEGDVPSNGRVRIHSLVQAVEEGDWVITAWAGTITEPRLAYDLLYIQSTLSSGVSSDKPFIQYQFISGNRTDLDNDVYAYTILFKDENPLYRSVVLSFPAVEGRAVSFSNQAYLITTNTDMIMLIRYFDFIENIVPSEVVHGDFGIGGYDPDYEQKRSSYHLILNIMLVCAATFIVVLVVLLVLTYVKK